MFDKNIDHFFVPSTKFQKIYSDFLKSTGNDNEKFTLNESVYEIATKKIYKIVHIDDQKLFLLANQNIEVLETDLIKNIVYYSCKKELPGSALKTFEAPVKIYEKPEFIKKFKRYYSYHEIVEKLYYEYKSNKLKLLIDFGEFCTLEDIPVEDQSEDLLWLLFFLYKNNYQIVYDPEKDSVEFSDYVEKATDKLVI